MTRWLLLGLFFIILFSVPSFASCTGSSPTWTATTWADIATCDMMASAGDSLILTATTYHTGAATLLNTSNICNVTGAGQGSTILDYETVGGISWIYTIPLNHVCRITGFTIQNNAGNGGAQAILYVQGSSVFSGGVYPTNLRIDHTTWNQPANQYFITSRDVVGVYDHNTITAPAGTEIFAYDFNDFWHGVGKYGDNSNFAALDEAGNLYIEDNLITCTTTCDLTDTHGGTRFAVRHNTMTGNVNVATHGNESSGREHGVRYVENYLNSIDWMGTDPVTDVRSGTPVTWGNVHTNALQVPAAANLKDERIFARFPPFLQADGTSPWDYNDTANNPYYTGTISGCGGACTTLTAKVAGTPYMGIDLTAGGLLQYFIKKTSPACDPTTTLCAAQILSNTSSTIGYQDSSGAPPPWFGNPLAFSDGDTFEINRMFRVYDQPGRADAHLLAVNPACPGAVVTGSSTTATVTCTGHGYSIGDWVTAWSQGLGGSSTFSGTAQVLASGFGANSFRYTCVETCQDGPGVFNDNVDLTAVPFTAGATDQVLAPGYQWLNVSDPSGANTNLTFLTCNVGCVQNREYFDYGGTSQSSSSSPFNGSSGIGVGTLAHMPGSCSGLNTGYWVLDHGSWNNSAVTYTVTGGADAGTYSQGVLYKCNGSTFDQFYTPYTYPHPLTGSSQSFSSQPTNTVTGNAFSPTITVTVSPAAADSITLSVTSGTCTFTGTATQTSDSMTGIATFNLTAGNVGTSCALTAHNNTDGTISDVISNSFNITSSCVPDHLTFTGQPSDALVGGSLGTVHVAVKDSGGNTCTSNTSTVILSSHAGSTAASLTSSSSLSKAAVAGVATWTDLSVTPTPGSISLDANDGMLTLGTSNPATISAAGSGGSSKERFRR